jgi:hypothetical protein
MKHTILFASFILIFASCANNSNNKGKTASDKDTVKNTLQSDSSETKNSLVLDSAVITSTTPDCYYKRFSGTIAGQPVVVQLCHIGGSNLIIANYYYVKQGKTIDLYMWDDTVKAGVYTLYEQVTDSADAKNNNPKWEITIDQSTIQGKWHSADGSKTYDIMLKEDYPQGSYKLGVYYQNDRISYKNVPKAGAQTAYMVLLPASDMNKEDAAFITSHILTDCGCDSFQVTHLKDCIGQKTKAYEQGYRQDFSDFDFFSDTTMMESTFHYQSSQAQSVVYNDDGWLVLESSGTDYFGGAHGSYNRTFINMDVAGKKLWELEDVMTADSATLNTLLEPVARRYFQLKADESLGYDLTTDIFHITPTGIIFRYDPYQFSSFSDGEITFFIPYTQLAAYLKPAFKQRMKL